MRGKAAWRSAVARCSAVALRSPAALSSARWSPRPFSIAPRCGVKPASVSSKLQRRHQSTSVHDIGKRVEVLETFVLGKACAGGMLPRVAALEEVLLGSAQTGGLPDRIISLESAAGLASPADATSSEDVREAIEHKCEDNLIFVGPKAVAVRVVKICSVTSCTMSLGTAAAAVLLDLEAVMPFAGRAALAGGLVFLGITTTGFLHWITKSYVVRVTSGANGVFVIEKVSFFGNTKSKLLATSDLMPPVGAFHPFLSFKDLRGQLYYLDPSVTEQAGGTESPSSAEDTLRILLPGYEPVQEEGHANDEDDY